MKEFKPDIDCKAELEEIAPILNSFDKSSLFQVPANYFDELPAKISHRVQAKTFEYSIWHFFRTIMKQRVAVPALMIICVVAGMFISKDSEKKAQLVLNPDVIQQADPSILLAYVNEYDLKEALIESDHSLSASYLDEDQSVAYLLDTEMELENLVLDNIEIN